LIKVSERVNLAVHALGYMASREEDCPYSVSFLAEKLGVSASHLAKVMQTLVRNGFVRSNRGARGGFSLDREPESLSILEIYEALEGPVIKPACLLGRPICKTEHCILKDLLNDMTNLLRDGLGKTNISDFTIENI